MKLFIFFMLLSVLIAQCVAWKNAACSEQFAKNSDEDGVACLAYMPRFSYNAAKNECSKFIYGGCHGNNNKFGTKKQCEAMCVE